ncbi:hypothetical protein DW831_02245 [Bacteroides uniformis]|uniref:Uncharacterized protein n=1 Tax=Bacteroides uniformis TaxID=820 RepID=A0A414BM42_BACUN|nr:hypothetical protein DXB40_02290 [Bacteroides sp. 4_1_36]RHC76261.1 hypothetical protein DW831_02245 [Bacteroides uniformis]RHK71717.1 hypothetical protein DW051_05155 [Bacteroides uniformis]
MGMYYPKTSPCFIAQHRMLWGKTSGCCGYSVSMSNLYSPYLFSSTSKLAASRQVKRSTV